MLCPQCQSAMVITRARCPQCGRTTADTDATRTAGAPAIAPTPALTTTTRTRGGCRRALAITFGVFAFLIALAILLCVINHKQIAVRWTAVMQRAAINDERTVKAFRTDDPSVFQQLLTDDPSLVQYRFENDHGRTLLHLAAWNGKPHIAELLLVRGADIHAVDREECTAFQFAIMRNHLDVVRVLLANGEAVNTKFAGLLGGTLLHGAVASQHHEIAAYLLAHGADINREDDCGQTPLHLAARCGDAGMTAQLLARGAAVDALDDGDETPLIKAVEEGHLEVVKILVTHGAKINIRTDGRVTPLFLAKRKSPAIAAYLKQHGGTLE